MKKAQILLGSVLYYLFIIYNQNGLAYKLCRLCFLTHKMDIPGCWVISRVILSGMTNALILRHYHAQQICREKEWKVPKQIQVEQLL